MAHHFCRFFIFYFLFFIFSITPVIAGDIENKAAGAAPRSLEEIQKQLAAHPVIRCEFRQQRKISGLARPLKSSGEILISREKGLWWHQKKPFEQTILLRPDRMVQTLAGQSPQIVTAAGNPQLFQFNTLLRAILNADIPALEKEFKIDLREKSGTGELRLTPLNSPLNKIFRHITLTFAAHLETVAIEDTQDDITEIYFSGHRTEPAELTEEEQRLFDSQTGE